MISYKILRPLVFIGLLTSCVATTPPINIPPPPPNDFSLSVWVDRPEYAINEKVVVNVQTTRDCYLTLFDITPAGTVTQIFPNRFASDNLVQANLTYQIPDLADKFDFQVTGPTGTETVHAVCTVDNVRVLPDELVNREGEFPRIMGSPSQFNEAVTKNLAVVSKDRKAEASTTFQVVRSR